MTRIPNWLWKLVLTKGLFLVALLALDRPLHWMNQSSDLKLAVGGWLVLLIGATVVGLLWVLWEPEIHAITRVSRPIQRF
jgi:K+ transporter